MLALAGCRSDVVIGVAPADGAPAPQPDAAVAIDAATGIMTGSYFLEHGDLAHVSCADPADDPRYQDLVPADVGLVSGEVSVSATPDELIVSGSPISTAYGQQKITLVHDLLPDQPHDLLFAVAHLDREGPVGHRTDQTVLGFYETGASSVAVTGESGALFVEQAGDAECGVMFIAHLYADNP